MREILLNDILKIPESEIQDYKVKFNVNNGHTEPLLVMSISYDEICNWIAWKKEKEYARISGNCRCRGRC